MKRPFLSLGNGHQIANRRKALEFALEHVPDLERIDEKTVKHPSHGICHFAAYTHPDGAMISTPGRDDDRSGYAGRERIMMFRDFGDGRVAIFVCRIAPLFDKRTIGHHGVPWRDVIEIAVMKLVLRT